MSKALSVDLRERVLSVVIAGASHREAAERFGVSAASVCRWRSLMKRSGHVRPGPLGGDRQSHKIEAHGATILARLEAKPDITLAELCEALRQEGLAISKSAMHRFLVRHDQTRKKRLATP